MPLNDKNNQDDHVVLHDEQEPKRNKIKLKKQAHVHNRHDLTFKRCMQFTPVILDFFNAYLPEHVRSIIQLTTITECKEHYVDDRLNVGIVDLLYSVNFKNKKNGPGYMYLHVEHQSSRDRFMPLRAYSYASQILTVHTKRYPKRVLPMIHSTLFFHGKLNQKMPKNFYGLFGNMKEHARKIMGGKYHCIDIKDVSDNIIHLHPWAGAMALMFKYADEPDFFLNFKTRLCEQLKYLQKEYRHEQGKLFVNEVLNYLLHKGNIDNKKQFIEYVKEEFSGDMEKNMASTTELYREEGLNEGMALGLSQGLSQGLQLASQYFAKRLIAEGFDDEAISRLAKLPMSDVNLIRNINMTGFEQIT